ncbi:hypothetical protein ACLOJK_003948 [Asimina triloba]
MDTNNYQWGYKSIYEEDVISTATAQLVARKERLEMNAQVGYEEDALSAAATQLAAWKERLEMNLSSSQQLHENQEFSELPSNSTPDFSQPMQQQEDEPSLEDLLVPVAQIVSLQNLETQMGQMTNTMAQLNKQPESFLSNTEFNPRHENRAQCPSVTVKREVQPEPQTQNAEELESPSCSSPNPSPAMPITQSPCKQPSFSEEKAPQARWRRIERKMRKCRRTQL